MKTWTTLVAATLAAAASALTGINADGVCYDPDHNSAKNAASVRADMNLIKSKGFSHVRTYITVLDPGPGRSNINIGNIICESGLRVALGVQYGVGDTLDQKDGAIATAKTYPGCVEYIFVGNENLGGPAPGDMIQMIRSIKDAVGGVKVGTVQTSAYLEGGAASTVVAASDVVGVNIHPFFHPGLIKGKEIDEALAQWSRVKSNVGGKLILTETGYPTSGTSAGNSGSVETARAYFQAYQSKFSFLGGNQKFYFQMFDTPYKPQEYEKNYGIFTASGNDKIGAGGSGGEPAPAPVQSPAPPTAAPTPSPSPTSTAPATTVPAASTPAPTNSTSSQDGSKAHETLHQVGSTSGSLGVSTGISGSTSGKGEERAAPEDAKEEAGVTESTPAPTVSATIIKDKSNTAGKSDGAVEANTQASGNNGTSAGLVIFVVAGCVAVVAAFGFIYKARQKAQELEDSERKSFDSVAITPGGGCVL